jgi:hypothetical protein
MAGCSLLLVPDNGEDCCGLKQNNFDVEATMVTYYGSMPKINNGTGGLFLPCLITL